MLITLGGMDLRAAGSPIPGEVPIPPAALAVERLRRGSARLPAGVLASAGALSFVFRSAAAQSRANRFWTEKELDLLLERYNEKQRSALGVSREPAMRDELGISR